MAFKILSLKCEVYTNLKPIKYDDKKPNIHLCVIPVRVLHLCVYDPETHAQTQIIKPRLAFKRLRLKCEVCPNFKPIKI